MIADTDLEFVFAGRHAASVDQTSQRQPLASVAVTTPVSSRLAEFLAILQERVLDINRGPQRGLIDSCVVDLHENADRRAAMVNAGNVWNHFCLANDELTHRGLIRKVLELRREHQCGG